RLAQAGRLHQSGDLRRGQIQPAEDHAGNYAVRVLDAQLDPRTRRHAAGRRVKVGIQAFLTGKHALDVRVVAEVPANPILNVRIVASHDAACIGQDEEIDQALEAGINLTERRLVLFREVGRVEVCLRNLLAEEVCRVAQHRVDSLGDDTGQDEPLILDLASDL